MDCSIASSAIGVASSIRGLSILRTVPCKLQSRAEVEKYLRQTLHKKVPAERVQREGVIYRLLGLIPMDYDYVNGVVKLYTDQIGGYYDPEKEYYAMAAWIPAVMQMPIAVHELTHALQDQHFNLDHLVDDEKEFSDTLMARAALIEGDATAVMIDYSRKMTGQPPISQDESVTSVMMQNISGAMISSSLTQAPASLQAMIIFPYVSGLNFVHVLLKKGGYKGIDEAFKGIPNTTAEILHPASYASSKRDFKELDVPKPPVEVKLSKAEPVFIDRLGEFVISTLLGSWLPPREASQAAAGWAADKLALYETKDSPGSLIVWDLLWETPEDAADFLQAISKAYEKRFAVESVKKSPEEVLFSKTEIGAVSITKNDRNTRVLIGLPAA